MKLLILSDFHIGTTHQFSSFGWKPDDLMQMIDYVVADNEIDKVILNGDVYELYQYQYQAVAESYPQLIAYFNKPIFFYIRGNHDALNEFGATEWNHTNSKGELIHIEHGHNADFMNGTALGRMLGRLFFHALKSIMKHPKLLKLYFDFMNQYEDIDRIPRKQNTFKYLSYALKLLKKYDVVIMGHTHKLESHKTYYLNQKKRYLNSGSCTLGRFQGILFDTESLKYETIKMSPKNVAKFLKKRNKINENNRFNSVLQTDVVFTEPELLLN